MNNKFVVRLSRWHSGKESACQCRRCKRLRLIPGSWRSTGVGTGNPLQYSCLGNSTGRGVWRPTVQGVSKSQTGLNTHWGTSCCCYLLSHVQLFCDPMDCSPPGSSVRGIFLDENTGVGGQCSSLGDLPDPGIKTGSPALQADSILSEPPGKPSKWAAYFSNNKAQSMGGKNVLNNYKVLRQQA